MYRRRVLLPMTRWTSRHFVATSYALALVARFALLLRTGPIASPDTSGYVTAAAAIRASLVTDHEGFLSLPPLFPLYLAVMPDIRIAVAGQVVLAALVAPLVGMAARRHFGMPAGWIAALLAALAPSFVFWSAYLLTDTLGLVFFAVAVERASAALSAPRARATFGAGAAAAAATLARAAYAAPLTVLGVAAALARPFRATAVVSFALGAALVLALPVARNVVATGEPFLYRDQGWMLVWQGTRWNEVGRGTAGVDIVYPPGYEAWSRERRNEYFRDEALTFVRERPLDFLGQMLKKSLWLWLPFYPDWSLAHKVVSGTFFASVYVLALGGLVSTWRSRFTLVLVGLLMATQLTVMVTIVDYDARYRLPAELCLLPLAGVGVANGWRRVRTAVRLPVLTPAG